MKTEQILEKIVKEEPNCFIGDFSKSTAVKGKKSIYYVKQRIAIVDLAIGETDFENHIAWQMKERLLKMGLKEK